MNLIKSQDFFDPTNDLKDTPIHIIGLGAIGSFVAENLARIGCPELHIYDFDTVEDTNIANQLYTTDDVGRLKTEALTDKLKAINPDIKLTTYERWDENNNNLCGYVFICVDTIAIRQAIVNTNKFNTNITAFFDFRMNLTDAQHYMAIWSDSHHKDFLAKTMAFTDEEAAANTPVSPCGTTLSIAPTVRTIVAAGIANFINVVKHNNYKTSIIIDPFASQYIAECIK